MSAKEEDINLLFKNGNQKKRKWWYFVIGCFLFYLLFSGVKKAFNLQILVEGQTISFAIFLLSIVFGFICNIIATWVFEKYKLSAMESDSTKRIDLIKNLAKEDLLIDILKQVNYYDNKYCEDYNIIAYLKKHPLHDSLYKCEVHYSYKKKKPNRNLIFQYIRIRNDVERASENEKNISHSFLNNEFYYVSDERDLKMFLSDIEDSKIEECYKLTHLEIRDSSDEIASVSYQKNNMIGCGNICRFDAEIPGKFSVDDDMLTIKYDLEYLIEKDSYTYFSFELPTKGIRVEFDFSDVADEIDCYVLDFLNSHIGPHPLHSPEDKKIILSKKEWILPKSSILFNWYQKRK